MPSLLIISGESEGLDELQQDLSESGFSCAMASGDDFDPESLKKASPDLVLIEMDDNPSDSGTWRLARTIKEKSKTPLIALLARRSLPNIDNFLYADDFLTTPYDTRELVLRMRRLLNTPGMPDSGETIRSNGMVIDLARCEVSIHGRRLELTFKEYELLRFLASNKGRVFTREALLDKVWGYDYIGGDRTVDTTIRRLRSKTDDPNNSFIETVRNVGYRFRPD